MFFYLFNNSNIERKNIEKNDKFYLYKAGEIFEPELSNVEIYQKVKNNDIENFIGEYNYFFEDDENIYIIIDELGAIKWFYYIDESCFSVSNNFWYMANKLDFGIDNIDIQSFYESVLFYFPLNNKTYFKNLNVVPSGSLLKYSKISKKLTIEKIKYISYKEKKLSKNSWFNKIDQAFIKTIKKIKQYNNSMNFAITISGGLDSRFPLFYTKNIKNTLAYLIGINNNFLDALDYKSAKKLAQYFKMKLLLIDPFRDIKFEKKVMIDISRNPIGASNVLKAINKKLSFKSSEQFNILLTGAYGGLIGGRILNDDLLNTSKKDLSEKMFIYYSSFSYLKELKTKNALKVFLKKNIKKVLFQFGIVNKQPIDINKEINLFLNDNFVIPTKNRSIALDSFKKNFYDDKDDINILSLIMRFHLLRHSIRGAFESLHGQVKSYSIYYPYIYELSKKWNVDYLKNRKLMEEFLLWKNEETSHIPLQSFDLPINLKFKKINIFYKFLYKLQSLTSFAIRGLVINYNKWWYKAESKNFYDQLKKEKCKTFEEIFNKDDIKIIYKYKRHNLLLEHILKLKYILIIIENKNYEKLINIDLEETSKY